MGETVPYNSRLALALLTRNKTALINEFKWARFIVIPKTNCKRPFFLFVKCSQYLVLYYGTNQVRWY